MHLLVGLGNPGAAYRGHRHNVGFMALDRIASRRRFPPFKRRFRGEIADGEIGGARVLALKPMTMMNLSGQSVGEAARFYKIAPGNVVVLYDELDLAPGKVRAKKGGGSGGHNGIRDVDRVIGAEFWRVRIGIGHPGDPARVTGHVLANFSDPDHAWLDPVLDAIDAAMPFLLDGDPSRFMTRVALLAPPPSPPTSSGTGRPDGGDGPDPA